MRNADCVALLKWALPRLGLRWEGFRGLHGQVCKRVARRARSLGLRTFTEYRFWLDAHPTEWPVLDQMCRVTISRFYRDRGVFECLEHEVLPALAERAFSEGRAVVSAWCAGCASGEEPWSLGLVWRFGVAHRFPQLAFQVRATDSDELLLARARAAVYEPGSLKELPEDWRERAFTRNAAGLRLADQYRDGVTFCCEDLRSAQPLGPFDLVLCRNSAFTYFAEDVQRRTLERLSTCLRSSGVLVIGRHERLPEPHAWIPAGRGGDFFFRPSS